MIAYLAGMSLALLAVFVLGMHEMRPFMVAHPGNWLAYGAAVLGVPLGVSWFVLALVQLIRPRRLLECRPRPVLMVCFVGLVAGLITVGLVIGAGAYGRYREIRASNTPNDGVLFGVASAVSSGGLLLCLPRVRRGGCSRCGYDLSGLRSPRCPECGTPVFQQIAGADGAV